VEVHLEEQVVDNSNLVINKDSHKVKAVQAPVLKMGVHQIIINKNRLLNKEPEVLLPKEAKAVQVLNRAPNLALSQVLKNNLRMEGGQRAMVNKWILNLVEVNNIKLNLRT
jgi:hypothetical protein